MTRPKGNNADEWNLYLHELGFFQGTPHLAVQIAEAIEDAVERCARIADEREKGYRVLQSRETRKDIAELFEIQGDEAHNTASAIREESVAILGGE